MTTTTKMTTKKRTNRSPIKLQPNAFQFEILELASKQRSSKKKVEVLQEYDNPGLRSILIWNFDESIITLLPEGEVPYSSLKDQTALSGGFSDKLGASLTGGSVNNISYQGTEEKVDAQHTSIRNEYRKFYNFLKSGNDSLSSVRRETMFIQILEGLHPKEAEILVLVKDRKLQDKYKITLANVQEAYPEIKWGGRS
jgi:hypothetical protein